MNSSDSSYAYFRTNTLRKGVIYWPPTQPSIREQVHPIEDIKVEPWLWTGWIGCRCDTHKKQVGVKQWYNPVRQEVQLVGVSLLQFEAVRTSSQQRAMGPQDPRLSSPAERERSAAKDGGTGGQYVAVSGSVSNSPLTHNPFITLSQPFRMKCERYIFLQCVRSSLLLILLPRASVYVTKAWTLLFFQL